MPIWDHGIWLLIAAGLTVTVAAIIQGSTGFGFALLVAPVLLLMDPAFVPGTVMLLGTLVTLFAAIRELHLVDKKRLAVGLLGRLPGAAIGGFIAAVLAPGYFGILFALLIFIALALSVFGPRIEPSLPNIGLAGFVSGVMGTVTSVGSPPMAIALQNAPGPEMRATASAFLLFGAVISMVALSLFGAFDVDDILRCLVLVPFAAVGFYFSRYVISHRRMDRYLRPIVLLLCLAMSVLLLIRSLLSLLS